MNNIRLSTGILKGATTEEELATLRQEMDRAQKGHRFFPWWALRVAIEEWKKRSSQKGDRAS